MEHIFDSLSEAFAWEYVRRGHRYLAVRLIDKRLGSMGAPAIEVIRAIENPGGDNRARYARLKDWENQTRSGVTIAQAIPFSFLAFGVWDEISANPGFYSFIMWHPDGVEFRKTDLYKTVVHESGVFDYWQARGFPPQCKPVGDDDFECVQLKTPRRRDSNLVN